MSGRGKMRSKKIWRIGNCDSKVVEKIQKKYGLSRIVAQILGNRNLTSSQDIHAFLYGDINDLRDPYEIPGIEAGTKRVMEALQNNESILIYGDYDVDGITATTLLTSLLRKLGGNVRYYIPDRLKEGYSLNKNALLDAKKAGTDLVITVDCGIASQEEAIYAKEIGLGLIITDHHQLPPALPQAQVVINPKIAGSDLPWSDLAGVGVAYKLAQAIAKKLDQEQLCEELLDLVTIGTIADIVPLHGENRILVKEGLKCLNKIGRPGLLALLDVCSLKTNEIAAEQISFMVAPRLNACGRLSDAKLGVELLLCSDEKVVRDLAVFMDQENRKRKDIESQIMDDAVEEIENKVDLSQDKIIILASYNWHPGVLGIVASRVAEKYYRPTILINLEEGIGKGSGRSIPGCNLYEALTNQKNLLLNFGGHEMAAGLSVKEENIPLLRENLNYYIREYLNDKDMIPIMKADSEVYCEEINKELVYELNKLAPFGCNNPQPVLIVRNREVASCKEVGANSKHLKCMVAGKNTCLDGIFFKHGSLKASIESWSKCDFAFVPEINNWNGFSRVQLVIKDIKPHREPDNPFVPLPFLDRLYLEGEVWLEDDYYRDIVNREEFYTKLVGVTFENRQEVIKNICDGVQVEIKREPDNPYDSNAIVITLSEEKLGYLNAKLARNLAATLDKGVPYEAYISQVTGRDKAQLGVNICIRKIETVIKQEKLKLTKGKLELLPVLDLEGLIREAVLGEYSYHEKQEEALRCLKDGKNSLIIFATGRGKSAVFQSLAPYLAVVKKKITLIVYPLRSLVNDQYQHLQDKLSPLGLSLVAINGSLNGDEKQICFNKLLQGSADIVLTTPEFLAYHIEKFKLVAEKIGLFVVDEAHHLAQGKRRGYRQLRKCWRELDKPLSLAATATANDEVAQKIKRDLEIETVVIDDYERTNLNLIDKRGETDKLVYLINLVSRDERVVIYVNSRKQAYQLAGELRLYYPKAKDEIGFYHGGLNSEDRGELEEMFRRGSLRVIVTTSAFGEGINIPDIRHVVLYHLCFSRTEFNQLSGRAGRDNEEAYIHMIFGEKDKKLNKMIIESAAPSREVLARFYMYLRSQANAQNPLEMTNQQFMEVMQKQGMKNFREHSATACLAVLEELGLVLREVAGSKRYIHFVPPPPGKLKLTDSVRYMEGYDEYQEFESFVEFVLNEKSSKILETINKPIFPLGFAEDLQANV